jgi:hypothetical protein
MEDDKYIDLVRLCADYVVAGNDVNIGDVNNGFVNRDLFITKEIGKFIYSKVDYMSDTYKVDDFNETQIFNCISEIISKLKYIQYVGEHNTNEIDNILSTYFDELSLKGICGTCHKNNLIPFGSTQCIDGCFICPKCGTHLSKSNYMMALYVIMSSDYKLCGIKCCCGNFSYHSIYSSHIKDIKNNKFLYIIDGKYQDDYGNEYETTYNFVEHLKQ